MANGQSGLSLAAPPGGGSGINLDQVLPFLMLLSPLLEMRSPGSGLGLSAGILGYQQAQQKKRRGESMSLLQLLGEVDDDQLETAQGALIDAGYTPALVKAMAKASRGMVDPARKAERALNQLVNDPSLGLIPRRTQIDIQARRQAEEQVAGREDVRFQRQEAAESQRFERGQVVGLAGEARSLLTSILLNPGASPQSRIQAQRLFSQLAQGADPQAILAEAQALVGQVGEAGAAQGLRERQLAFRKQRLGELGAEVESAVPAAAARIRRLAKEQGLDPAPYLQRLVQNIKRQRLQEQVLARQAAGPQGGGLSLSDLKLAAFLGQIDPTKLTDTQRELIGLPPQTKELADVEKQMREIGSQFRFETNKQKKRELSAELKALTVRHQALLRKAGAGPPAPPAPPRTTGGAAPSPAKTLTMAQVQAGAKAAGITVEQALADARRQGYIIVR